MQPLNTCVKTFLWCHLCIYKCHIKLLKILLSENKLQVAPYASAIVWKSSPKSRWDLTAIVAVLKAETAKKWLGLRLCPHKWSKAVVVGVRYSSREWVLNKMDKSGPFSVLLIYFCPFSTLSILFQGMMQYKAWYHVVGLLSFRSMSQIIP